MIPIIVSVNGERIMYVCICNAVTDNQILEAQQNGHTSVRDISRLLGVGKCCGKCIDTAKEVLKQGEEVKKYIPNLIQVPTKLQSNY